MCAKLTSVFLIDHSPKLLVEQQIYIDKLVYDRHSLFQCREIRIYELPISVINLPIYWLANTCYKKHELSQSDVLFQKKNFLKILNSLIIFSMYSHHHFKYLIFWNMLIIALLKQLGNYFSIWIICICYHFLFFSPWILNCMMKIVYKNVEAQMMLFSFSEGSPFPSIGRQNGG